MSEAQGSPASISTSANKENKENKNGPIVSRSSWNNNPTKVKEQAVSIFIIRLQK